jgi:hypothetical protein
MFRYARVESRARVGRNKVNPTSARISSWRLRGELSAPELSGFLVLVQQHRRADVALPQLICYQMGSLPHSNRYRVTTEVVMMAKQLSGWRINLGASGPPVGPLPIAGCC